MAIELHTCTFLQLAHSHILYIHVHYNMSCIDHQPNQDVWQSICAALFFLEAMYLVAQAQMTIATYSLAFMLQCLANPAYVLMITTSGHQSKSQF